MASEVREKAILSIYKIDPICITQDQYGVLIDAILAVIGEEIEGMKKPVPCNDKHHDTLCDCREHKIYNQALTDLRARLEK